MDKKGIIGISLAIAVMVLWQWKFAPKFVPPVPATVAETASASASPTAGSTPAMAAPAAVAKPADADTPPAVAEVIEKVRSPSVEYAFTNLGGGIARADLLKHKAEQGENVVLNSAGTTPIGAVTEKAGEGNGAPFQISVNREAREVVYERETPAKVRLTKKFILPSADQGTGEYLVGLDVTFKNEGTEAYRNDGWLIHTGAAAPIHKNDLPTYTSFNWFAQGKMHSKNVTSFAEGRIPLLGIQTSVEKPSLSEQHANISWAGVRNQYFTSIITSPEGAGTGIWTTRFHPHGDATALFAVEGALGMPGFTLGVGETQTSHFELWIGPKEYDKLKRLGHQEDEIMEFGMFKWVSEFLLSSMNWLHSIFENFGGYAVAIIILTLCIRSAMWPLVNKSTQSMKKMQAVQPKMAELKEKYKDDPTRMNTELMKLYKEYGINPFGGCIPMLFQIPIFFGFYAMLGTAIELRNSHFLWVRDLSQAENNFYIAGVPINFLPLCMAATMLWQMSLTPKTGDAVQQRIFMFVPLIFIYISYNYASALALYWTVQNLFSIGQLYVTRGQAAPVLQKVTPPKRRK